MTEREKFCKNNQTKKPQGLKNLCDMIKMKMSSIHVIGVLEKQGRSGQKKHIFEEMMAKSFLYLVKGINLQIQEN